jgi:hypothetical protein
MAKAILRILRWAKRKLHKYQTGHHCYHRKNNGEWRCRGFTDGKRCKERFYLGDK